MKNKSKLKMLVFGEVLWDIYPQIQTIGGAPFNFASHLVRLGDGATLLSAIGDDELGAKTRDAIINMGVDDKYVRDTSYPTGFCAVTVENGSPHYELREGVAYDYIDTVDDVTEYDCLYFGTLAQRNTHSRNTLKLLIDAKEWECILFDINIRQSFYCKEIIKQGLESCHILKISREEADIFHRVGLSSLKQDDYATEDEFLMALAKELAEEYQIEDVVITLDKDGAMAYDGRKFFYAQNPPCHVVSTVGGGDSFFACYAHFKIAGYPIYECLLRAVTLSSYVVSCAESIPQYTKELCDKLAI